MLKLWDRIFGSVCQPQLFSDCTQSNLSTISFCCRFRTRTAPYDGRRPDDVLKRSITYIREQIMVQANLAETEFEKVYPEKVICNCFLAHLLILHTISGVCSWPVSTKVVPGSREHWTTQPVSFGSKCSTDQGCNEHSQTTFFVFQSTMWRY